MRCPKCGLTSFDYNETCPKCGKDLMPLREMLNLSGIEPKPVSFLGTLLADEGDGDFSFEGEDTEHLDVYDDETTEITEETGTPSELEEVATLEIEAGPDEEIAPAKIDVTPEEGIDFEFSEEDSGLKLETEESSGGLDAEETLILEPEEEAEGPESEPGITVEPEEEMISFDSEEDDSEEIDLEFETMADDELSVSEDEELDLSDLSLESENIEEALEPEEEVTLSLKEPVEEIGAEPDMTAEAELISDDTEEEELDLTNLGLELEGSEDSGEDEVGELELSDLELEEDTITPTSEPDESLAELIAEEAADEEKLGLDDETVIIEDTGEDTDEGTELETPSGPEEDDLDEIELNFDDLELEEDDKT